MRQQLQFKTIFYWLAFLALGAFSCYWTAESLYIWQPVLGMAGAWLIAILFYVMASLSFSLLLNSLSKSYDFYGKFLGRGASFVVGLLGLILFWIVCSMPTNTHTLLYNAEVRNTVSSDLSTTLKYLNALEKNNAAINKIDAKYDAKVTEVKAIFVKMLAEMEDPTNKGIGIRFRNLVAELNTALAGIDPNGNSKPIQEVKNPGSNQKQWLATYYQYQAQADAILKIYRESCNTQIASIRKQMNSKELKALIADCGLATKDIAKMQGVNHEVIDAASKDLIDSYSYISDHASFIKFESMDDSLNYCRENAQPKVKSLQVVPKVWTDYLTTERFDGHGFTWWILISLLVDIAGFIFFYLANKQ